jgi:hypothetical protein
MQEGVTLKPYITPLRQRRSGGLIPFYVIIGFIACSSWDERLRSRSSLTGASVSSTAGRTSTRYLAIQLFGPCGNGLGRSPVNGYLTRRVAPGSGAQSARRAIANSPACEYVVDPQPHEVAAP